jgi:hypothetical protein
VIDDQGIADEVNLRDWQAWLDTLVPPGSPPESRDLLTTVFARTEARCAAVLALVIAGDADHLNPMLDALDSRIALRMMVACVNRVLCGVVARVPDGAEVIAASTDAAQHLAALWSAYADEAEARLHGHAPPPQPPG